MKAIGLVAVGNAPDSLIAGVKREIEAVYGWPTMTLGRIEAPEEAYIQHRKQYYAHLILQALVDGPWQDISCDKVLGVSTVDLATPVLTFVFGEAQLQGRYSLMSLARLDEAFHGRSENGPLLLSRSTKEAVHELGHAFGLVHCLSSRCVMFFSRNLEDVDGKRADFCPRCWKRLSILIQGKEES